MPASPAPTEPVCASPALGAHSEHTSCRRPRSGPAPPASGAAQAFPHSLQHLAHTRPRKPLTTYRLHPCHPRNKPLKRVSGQDPQKAQRLKTPYGESCLTPATVSSYSCFPVVPRSSETVLEQRPGTAVQHLFTRIDSQGGFLTQSVPRCLL